jgi:phosphoglycerol transferase MdoB-like AlkP superfamily enzyme
MTPAFMTALQFTQLRSRARQRLLDSQTGHLSRFAIAGLTGLIGIGLAYYHFYHEGERQTITFAAAITTALIAFLTFATRRVLFSTTVVAAIVALIVVAADVKRHYIDMVLHAYDVVFYFTSWSTLSFLWVDHKGELLLALLAVAAIGAFGAVIYAFDGSAIPRSRSAAVFFTCVAAALWASAAKPERRHTLFHWDSLYLSSFYASWSETLETLWRGQLLEALASQSKPAFKIPLSCVPDKGAPHIILIHQESVVPPSHFATLSYDKSLDPFFNSFDGKLHKLRVETYGGASWLTEFSVLAGVSTYSFGGMRTFVQSMMSGKIRETLPQTLSRCGYRNSMFYPVPKDFVGSGRFYKAIGLADIFDFRGQGAKRYNERDQFYYGNALSRIENQLAEAKGPLFSYIMTSATHLPYTSPYEPEVVVPGGGPHTDPEMNEYLRRLAMAKMDYVQFRADLKRRFPDERFLIVQYGDHQPIATRSLLGFGHLGSAEDIVMGPDSPGYLTYYAVEGVNYDPPPLPTQATIDVPFLGAMLLQAARLPLSEAYAERLRLMQLCDGRYHACARRDEILGFHRRLMDSGMVDAR